MENERLLGNPTASTTANMKNKGSTKDLESGLGTYISDYIDYNELNVRVNFVRKVYAIVCVQLFTSLMFIFATMTHENLRIFVQTNAAVQFLCIIVTFAVIIMLICTKMGKQHPTNMYLLSVFTLAESYLLACATSMYPTTSILQAIGITTGVTFGLTLYTWTTTRDLSGMGTYLYCALLVMIFGGFIRMFFPSMPLVDTVYAMCGALLFSLYIIYDTYLLLNKLGPDDYVFAALNLYLDIINLFLYILRLIGKKE